MKRVVIFLMLIGTICSVRGQQISQYSQYVFNQFALNPAVAGTKECIDTRLFYREQWLGLDGAPSSFGATMHGQIPRRMQGGYYYFHGVGGKVEYDRVGPFSVGSIELAYAYNMPVFEDARLAFGTFVGVQYFQVDPNKILVPDNTDPILDNLGESLIVPDIRPGMWMYSDRFYLGITIRQLLANSIGNLGDQSNNLGRHYSINYGRQFENYIGWSLLPSAMLRMPPNSAWALDLNLMVDYQNKFAFGLNYRNTDSFAGMFKLSFLEQFFIGYSYDFGISKLAGSHSNTHEISLGILTCKLSNSGRDSCPAFQ